MPHPNHAPIESPTPTQQIDLLDYTSVAQQKYKQGDLALIHGMVIEIVMAQYNHSTNSWVYIVKCSDGVFTALASDLSPIPSIKQCHFIKPSTKKINSEPVLQPPLKPPVINHQLTPYQSSLTPSPKQAKHPWTP